MPLIQLHRADGSWARLKAGWDEQCKAVDEDFGLYAQGTFLILDQLAETPERKASTSLAPAETAHGPSARRSQSTREAHERYPGTNRRPRLSKEVCQERLVDEACRKH
jgi:hypothetical protein